MAKRILHFIVALGVFVACAPGQPTERLPASPQSLAGTWTYAFPDPQRLGGTIFIPSDTSADAPAEITSSSWPGAIEYAGVLNALIHSGRYVCWVDSTRQDAGFELTVHLGKLLATYFDSCARLARRTGAASQRSVRDCRHTLLTLRRMAPPDDEVRDE